MDNSKCLKALALGLARVEESDNGECCVPTIHGEYCHPGLEAYRGDIHFCWVSPFTFGSGYAGLGNCVNRELGNSRVPEYALPGGIGLQRGALLSIE